MPVFEVDRPNPVLAIAAHSHHEAVRLRYMRTKPLLINGTRLASLIWVVQVAYCCRDMGDMYVLSVVCKHALVQLRVVES